MPAGRPKIKRTQEDAKEAQRLSKRLYARRIRSQQASVMSQDSLPPTPPESEISRAATPSHELSLTSFKAFDVTDQHLDPLSNAGQNVIPWLGDLELLHHFTTQTCYTLSDKAQSQQLWQTAIPQIAFSYPFLMRGLLAVSAFHLAYLRPEETRHFEIKAMAHQHMALGPFQDCMKHLSPSNCDALFAFSGLLIVLGFAAPHSSSSHTVLDVREKTTRWIRLVRGVHPMLEPMWSHIGKGKLSALLTAGVWKSEAENLSAEPFACYNELCRLCEECEDSEIKASCEAALEDLRLCFVCMDISLKNPAMSDDATVMSWPAGLLSRYLTALEQGHPTAMLILAYYTVVLHRLDHYWWINGEPSRILLAVYWLLDESMRLWLHWPLQVLNLEHEAKSIV